MYKIDVSASKRSELQEIMAPTDYAGKILRVLIKL